MGFLPIPVDITKRLDTLETQLGHLEELFEENNAIQNEMLELARGTGDPRMGHVTPIGQARASGKR